MNDSLNVIVFVLTTQNYPQRINNIIETWGNDIDTVFYSDHEDNIKNIIKVSNRKDYVGAEEKQINVLNNIKYYTNDEDIPLVNLYDWFFFVDDDTFVNTTILKKYVKNLSKENVYGQMFCYEKDYDNPAYSNGIVPKSAKFPSGGAGFLVSSTVLKGIETFINYMTGNGDVSAGLNFHFNNVNQVHLNLMNSQTPEVLNHDVKKIKEQISYHFIRTEEQMKKLYEYGFN